jgi:hypothetical protein
VTKAGFFGFAACKCLQSMFLSPFVWNWHMIACLHKQLAGTSPRASSNFGLKVPLALPVFLTLI